MAYQCVKLLSLNFSPGTSEINEVGVIFRKGLGYTIIETDGLPLGWSLGPLLGMWEGLLLGIAAGRQWCTPLGWWVGKWLGIPLGFNICNTLVVVLGKCDGFLLGFAPGKNLITKKVCYTMIVLNIWWVFLWA